MNKKQLMEVFEERIKQLSDRTKDKKISPRARLIWQSSLDELNAMKQLLSKLAKD